MRTKRAGQHGFTMIELISVIIILGILAAVIVPRYLDMTTQAKAGAAKGAVSEGIARFNLACAQYLLTSSGTRPSSDAAGLTSLGLGNGATGYNIGDYWVVYTPVASSTIPGWIGNATVQVEAFGADSATKAKIGTALASQETPWPQ